MSTAVQKEGVVGRLHPFDESGVYRGEDGILHYEGLPPSLVAMLRDTAQARPDHEAIVEIGGESLTYAEFWDRAARVAGGLAAAGVERGDRVAIRLGNGVDWCLAFFGGLMAGAIVVPVNTRFAEPEVAYVIDDSGARFVFLPGEALPAGDPMAVDDVGPTDVAAILYTSGTTGSPKGAMTTHENFTSNVETVLRASFMGASETTRMLVSVPLFHVTGCNSQLLPMIRLGATTVIMPVFDVDELLSALVDYRTDAMVGVPAILWLAMDRPQFKDMDFSHVRWVTYGGAPMPPEQVGDVMRAFPNARLGNGYGLTETASVTTFLTHEHSRERPETVGFASPVAELRLEDSGFEGGAGELLIRSPQVVAGYWNKPDETARAFDDGWLRTGDVATIDEDGFVEIVDRIKDLINRGGENVYSIEVDNAISLHPSVTEVSVVGVPDPVMGEKVGAIVVVREGEALTAAELVDFLSSRLADFKIPQYVVIQNDPLPRNPGGKILKAQLRGSTEWGEQLSRRPAGG
ncbi:MAG TPA: AMP-binding protein [Baekduia sp.]|jgi:acyl-CoA synthetase (AMP-forming)/AMP-acid ligase II|nr:AMP-binding protein [Baekduia sp.]